MSSNNQVSTETRNINIGGSDITISKHATRFIIKKSNNKRVTETSGKLEEIEDGLKLKTIQDDTVTLSQNGDFYIIIFYFITPDGEIRYTDIYGKKHDGDINDPNMERLNLENGNIYDWLNNKIVITKDASKKPNREENEKTINNLRPYESPKPDYSNDLKRVQLTLRRHYEQIVEYARVNINGIQEMNSKHEGSYNTLRLYCKTFIKLLNDIREKNRQNSSKMASLGKEKSEAKFLYDVDIVDINGTYLYKFFFPPFNLEDNKTFLDELNYYDSQVTKILDKIQPVEVVNNFMRNTKQNTANFMNRLGDMRNKFSNMINELLFNASIKDEKRLNDKMRDFNAKKEKWRQELTKMINDFEDPKNKENYTDSGNYIDNAVTDLVNFFNDQSLEIRNKFKHDTSEIKLINRQKGLLKVHSLDTSGVKPNKHIELLGNHYMNYFSAMNVLYNVHYMNEFLRQSVSYDNNNSEKKEFYKVVPFDKKYENLKYMRIKKNIEARRIDMKKDIGYSNFLFLVDEFMHVFNKIRYHPLIYKLNGINKDQFKLLFINTPEFMYRSEAKLPENNMNFANREMIGDIMHGGNGNDDDDIFERYHIVPHDLDFTNTIDNEAEMDNNKYGLKYVDVADIYENSKPSDYKDNFAYLKEMMERDAKANEEENEKMQENIKRKIAKTKEIYEEIKKSRTQYDAINNASTANEIQKLQKSKQALEKMLALKQELNQGLTELYSQQQIKFEIKLKEMNELIENNMKTFNDNQKETFKQRLNEMQNRNMETKQIVENLIQKTGITEKDSEQKQQLINEMQKQREAEEQDREKQKNALEDAKAQSKDADDAQKKVTESLEKMSKYEKDAKDLEKEVKDIAKPQSDYKAFEDDEKYVNADDNYNKVKEKAEEERNNRAESEGKNENKDYIDSKKGGYTQPETWSGGSALFQADAKDAVMTGGKKMYGTIRGVNNYNLKHIKKAYLNMVYKDPEVFCNFVNSLEMTVVTEQSKRLITFLRYYTSNKMLKQNGDNYKERYYFLKVPATLKDKQFMKVNVFHFMGAIFDNYTDFFSKKGDSGMFVKMRFFSTMMRNIISEFVYVKKLIHLFEYQHPKFIKRIDYFIDDVVKNNFLSYIKFRSDDIHNYNARYNIFVNRVTENMMGSMNNVSGKLNTTRFIYSDIDYNNTLLVKYNDDDRKYYEFDDASNKTDNHYHPIINYKISDEVKKFRMDDDSYNLDLSGNENKGNRQYSLQDEITYMIRDQLKTYPTRLFYTHKNTGNLVFPKYDHNYMFGKFTKIFNPSLQNREVAEQMDDIVRRLLQHKPVFVLGYGASGAGKTSSLIYFKKGTDESKNGIIIHVCNILAKKGFTHIELCSEEYYDTQHYDEKGELLKNPPNPTVVKVPLNSSKEEIEDMVKAKVETELNIAKPNVLHFEYSNNEFVFSKVGDSESTEYNHKNLHRYRIDTPQNGGEPTTELGTQIKNKVMEELETDQVYSDDFEQLDIEEEIKTEVRKQLPQGQREDVKTNEVKTDEVNTDKVEEVKPKYDTTEQPFTTKSTLAEVMIHMVDTDRLVKATTNNVNSSRSHTLVYVKLIRNASKLFELTKKPEYLENTTIEERLRDQLYLQQFNDKNLGVKEETLNLIIGDFAGVENEFTCGTDETLMNFQTIKSDRNPRDNFYFESAKEVAGVYDNGEGGYEIQQTGGDNITMSKVGFAKLGYENDNDVIDKILIPSLNTTNVVSFEDKKLGEDIREHLMIADWGYGGFEDEKIFEKYFKSLNKENIMLLLKDTSYKSKYVIKEEIHKYIDVLTDDDKTNVDENNWAYQIYLKQRLRDGKIDLIDINVSHDEMNNISFLNNYHADLNVKTDSTAFYGEGKNNELSALAQKIKNFKSEIDKQEEKIQKQQTAKREKLDSIRNEMALPHSNVTNNIELYNKNIGNIRLNNQNINSAYKKINFDKLNALSSLCSSTNITEDSEIPLTIETLNKAGVSERDNNTEAINTLEAYLETEKTKVSGAVEALKVSIKNLEEKTKEHTGLSRNIAELYTKKDNIEAEKSECEDFNKRLASAKIEAEKYATYHVEQIKNIELPKVTLQTEKIDDFVRKTIEELNSEGFREKVKNNTVKFVNYSVHNKESGSSKPAADIIIKRKMFVEYLKTYLDNSNKTIDVLKELKLILTKSIEKGVSHTNPSYNYKGESNAALNQFWYNDTGEHVINMRASPILRILDLLDSGKPTLTSDTPRIKNFNNLYKEATKNVEQYENKLLERKKYVIGLGFNVTNDLLSNDNLDQLKETLKSYHMNQKGFEYNTNKEDCNKISAESILATISEKESQLKSIDLKELESDVNTKQANLKTLTKNKEANAYLSDISQQIKREIESITYVGTKLLECVKYANIITENKQKLQELKKSLDEIDNEKTGTVDNIIYYSPSDDLSKLEENKIARVQSLIVELLWRARFRYLYIKQICLNRGREGKFINQSLADMRETFSDILEVKNEACIDMVPSFVDVCMKSYCPKYENCFRKNESLPNFNKIKSQFIQAIREKTMPTANIEEFYMDLQICAFCVVNITVDKTASNPPPSPYIDINQLKKLFLTERNTIFGNPDSLEFKYEDFGRSDIVHKATKPPYETIRTEFKEECQKLLHIIENKYSHGDRLTFITYIQQSNEFKAFKDFVEKRLDQIYNEVRTELYNQVKDVKNAIQMSKIPEYLNNLQQFLNYIDNINATSTIGTLEFMDKMVKYNQVNVICKIPDETNVLDLKMVDLKNAIRMQNEAMIQKKYEMGMR